MVLAGLACAAALPLLAAPPASATTPTSGASYANRVSVDGQCSLTLGVDYRRRSWMAVTIDPKRVHGGSNGGVEIAPAALPRIEEMAEAVVDDFSAAPYPQGWAEPTDESTCAVTSLSFDAEVSGTSLILGRPGPYVFMQHDFQTHWVQLPDGPEDPQPIPCMANDDAYHQFSQGDVPAADPADGHHWAVETFCNEVTVVSFNVRGDTGGCPVSGDMSQWPTAPYINQYDAGARLGLPVRFGFAGGNACGPSSLLMALLRGGTPVLPELGDVFDAVMQRTRATVAPNQQNAFDSARAVAYLQSLGFRQARVINLGRSSDAANVDNVAHLYEEVAFQRPVLVSTAFGTRRWGVTGGGHMIAVTGIQNGNFVVMDPAGNFFGDRTGHYGAGKCGYGVTYPVAWVKASIVGRYIVKIGAHTPRPRAAFSSRTTSASLGTAVSVTDTHPESTDNPRTFYLQDPQGRRAGWIDGTSVEEIPDSWVGKPPATWADPAAGDPDFDPAPEEPPATPRAIVVPDPPEGTLLHVLADQGAPYALTVDAWVDGGVVARDDLSGSGTGGDATVTSSALTGLAGAPTPTPTPTSTSTPTPTPTPAPASPVAPAVTRLAISPSAFRAASSGASARAAARRRTGGRVTFRLNIAATVRVRVERRAGRRHRRVSGSFKRAGKPGANAFVFTGRIARRKLRAGRYRLVAVPSAAGRSGAAARVAFRIKP